MISIARSLYEEAIPPLQVAQDRHFEAMLRNNLGDVVVALGDPVAARAHYEDALAIWRQRQDTWGIGIALLNLGNMALRTGDVANAGVLFGEGLTTCEMVGDKAAIADYLDAVGRLAAVVSQWAGAARLLSAAAAIYQLVGIEQSPGRRADHDEALAAARTGLGDESFAVAYQAGQLLLPEQAMAEAITIASQVGIPRRVTR